jgi:hypothetical protein
LHGWAHSAGQSHRIIVVDQYHDLLQKRRWDQQTEQFKERMQQRNAIEGTIAEKLKACYAAGEAQEARKPSGRGRHRAIREARVAFGHTIAAERDNVAVIALIMLWFLWRWDLPLIRGTLMAPSWFRVLILIYRTAGRSPLKLISGRLDSNLRPPAPK